MSINFLYFGKWNKKYLFSSLQPRREIKNFNSFPAGKLLGIYKNVLSQYSWKSFSVISSIFKTLGQKTVLKGVFISCYIFNKSWIYSLSISGGNCHVEAKLVAPGSSEVIGHGNEKNGEVQKPLFVTLHADICCIALLHLLISLSTKYSLCPACNTPASGTCTWCMLQCTTCVTGLSNAYQTPWTTL